MSTQISGQITVATAGTAVQGPDIVGGLFSIRALSTNSGAHVYIGDDGTGDVSSTTGFSLATNDLPVVVRVPNLSVLWFDVATSGDGLCWLRLDV